MKPKSSGNAPAIGTSNSGPGPSGSMVRAPLVEKKIAICDCAPTATAPGAPTRFGRDVCGFFGERGVCKERQIITEECGAGTKIAGTNQRCRSRIGYSLVAAGKLDDHRFGQVPGQR